MSNASILTKFGSYQDTIFSTAEMNKYAYANSSYRRLANIARKYYPDDSLNTSWKHIQDVRRRASNMIRNEEGRQLTPEEYAAILFHDCTKADLGEHHHGALGAERAAKLLANSFDGPALERITKAIAYHDQDDHFKGHPFPNHTADLLASADANPPDFPWVLNKSYNYALKHGKSGDHALYTCVLEHLPEKYGSSGTFEPPPIYKRYYGDAYKDFVDNVDNMTYDNVKNIIQAYRKKNGLEPGKSYRAGEL